jgi:glycosyltransferase involved in cell wall biosynthesis
MTRTLLHAITPGDHYSPRTGSAVPTVVHGLAEAAARDGELPRWEHAVLLDSSTYQPRYTSARAIEYSGAQPPHVLGRVADAVLARAGLPRRTAARAWQPLADALAELPAGVVVAHNAPAFPHLLRGQRHATVLYAHNDILRTVGRREAERTLAEVAAIVCVSADLAQVTAARLPRRLANRVHSVDNGVDTAMFSPAMDAQPRERLRVMYLGRVIADKGPDVLLRAAQTLPADVEYVIVGSTGFDPQAPLSPYERSLRTLAQQCPGRVTFEPFVDRVDLPALLRTADVFVVPSRWREPSGLTIGEAMATGLPVVASRVGGIPEVLGDAGVLVEKDQPAALADALRTLLHDPAARTELGAAARRRAESRDWSHSWRQLRSVVEGL